MKPFCPGRNRGGPRLFESFQSTGLAQKQNAGDGVAGLLSHQGFQDVAFVLAGRVAQAESYLNDCLLVGKVEINTEIVGAADLAFGIVGAELGLRPGTKLLHEGGSVVITDAWSLDLEEDRPLIC